jgi:hypothetical protein
VHTCTFVSNVLSIDWSCCIASTLPITGLILAASPNKPSETSSSDDAKADAVSSRPDRSSTYLIGRGSVARPAAARIMHPRAKNVKATWKAKNPAIVYSSMGETTYRPEPVKGDNGGWLTSRIAERETMSEGGGPTGSRRYMALLGPSLTLCARSQGSRITSYASMAFRRVMCDVTPQHAEQQT